MSWPSCLSNYGEVSKRKAEKSIYLAYFILELTEDRVISGISVYCHVSEVMYKANKYLKVILS